MPLTPDEARRLLEYEVANKGKVPREALDRAAAVLRGGAGETPMPAEGPGALNLPEQKITPRGFFGRLFNTGVDQSAAKAIADSALAEPEAPKTGIEGAVGRGVGAGYVTANRFANSALLGAPDMLGLTTPASKGEADLRAAHPTADVVGEFLGAASGGNPANLAARGLAGAAGRAIPKAAGSYLGRTALAAGEAGLGGALGAGARTAVEGGDVGDAGESAVKGGLTGAALGGLAHGTIGEGALYLRGNLRERIPEIGKAEKGGARLGLTGVDPGEEMGAIRRAALEADAPTDVDFQARKLVDPLTTSGTRQFKDVTTRIGQEVEAYAQTPAGQTRRPMTGLLKQHMDEYAKNIAGESGAPVAGAELGDLRRNINALADVKLVPPGSQPFQGRGGFTMSLEEAEQHGLDVSRAMKELPNPEAARFMDVAVVPRRYDAKELLQAVDNIRENITSPKTGPTGADMYKRLENAALGERDQFPGLSEMSKRHEAVLGPLKQELAAARIPTGGARATEQQKETLFETVKGYKNSRYGGIDEALRNQADLASQPAATNPNRPSNIPTKPAPPLTIDELTIPKAPKTGFEGTKTPSSFEAADARVGDLAERNPDGKRDVLKFLNEDRARVSLEQRSGASPLGDRVDGFLRDAQRSGGATTDPVYRGVSTDELKAFLNNPEAGHTLSASMTPEGAKGFAKKSKVVLKIDDHPVPVNSIGGSNTFEEALIPKGTKFDIVGDSVDDAGLRTIEVRTVKEQLPGATTVPAPPLPRESVLAREQNARLAGQDQRGLGLPGPPPPEAAPPPNYRRELDMVAALKALKAIETRAHLNPFRAGTTGNMYGSVPMTAVRMRADPLLEALLGIGVPTGQGVGTMAGTKERR